MAYPLKNETPQSSTPPTLSIRYAPDRKIENTLVTVFIIVTVLLAVLPCLVGFAESGQSAKFVGAVYDIDDTAVYYSWTRQAADGHFFIRNLFTTEAQNAIQFNLLFGLLGLVVRFSGLSIPVVFLVARICAASGLLYLIYRFFNYLFPLEKFARLCAFFLVCLGNGFGWIFLLCGSEQNAVQVVAADLWQPEALTFQSIEMSLLFTVSQILMVGIIFLLLIGQRTGMIRYAAGAGILALLLGNVHSYDILHVAAAWSVYLAALCMIQRRLNLKLWLLAGVSCIIGLPSTLYQFHMYLCDPAWRARVLVLTLAPPFESYVRGWGFVFIFAVIGIALYVIRRSRQAQNLVCDPNSLMLAACWILGALIATYGSHATFQRRMIMGADIPLSLLAGCGIAILTAEYASNKRIAIASLCCLITIPTSIVWVCRDIRDVLANTSKTQIAPFLSGDQINAFAWIRAHTDPSAAILGESNLMLFVPGYCDRSTYDGHWGETPNFGAKLRTLGFFFRNDMPDAERRDFLASTHCGYFVFPNAKEGSVIPLFFGRTEKIANFHSMPDLLRPVYSNKELTIYKIISAHLAK